MNCSMGRTDSHPARTGGTSPLPPAPLPKLPRDEKHLDAALLAVVRRRRLELGVLPGIPFN
jgi:hypothetical protein